MLQHWKCGAALEVDGCASLAPQPASAQVRSPGRPSPRSFVRKRAGRAEHRAADRTKKVPSASQDLARRGGCCAGAVALPASASLQQSPGVAAPREEAAHAAAVAAARQRAPAPVPHSSATCACVARVSRRTGAAWKRN